jgi:gas vesicle protein
MMGRRDRKRLNFKALAIGSSVAAAAGYVAGLLTAPKSGKQTRQDLKQAADKGATEAEKELKKLHGELDKVLAEAKVNGKKAGRKAQAELSELVAKAKDNRERAREILGAVREGKAADKDLNKAVKDARAAVTHLRDYLKKK